MGRALNPQLVTLPGQQPEHAAHASRADGGARLQEIGSGLGHVGWGADDAGRGGADEVAGALQGRELEVVDGLAGDQALDAAGVNVYGISWYFSLVSCYKIA